MTLRQLEYVLAVAEFRSFTKAADHLHVSQPSLSQQVQSLEAEIGAQLFYRPPNRVRLTAVGSAFIEEARVAVTSSRRALDAARRVVGLEPEAITVATVTSVSASLSPRALLRWREMTPGVAVHLREYAHVSSVEQAVRERTAELGIGPAPLHWDGAIHRLGWDELVLILPVDDELATSASPVRLDELADRRWVLFEHGHGLSETVELACAAAGFKPQPVLRTTQVDAAARLAANGVGPALVPYKNVPEGLCHAVRPLDPPVSWEVAAFSSTPRFSRLSQRFIDALTDGDWDGCPPSSLALNGSARRPAV